MFVSGALSASWMESMGMLGTCVGHAGYVSEKREPYLCGLERRTQTAIDLFKIVKLRFTNETLEYTPCHVIGPFREAVCLFLVGQFVHVRIQKSV